MVVSALKKLKAFKYMEDSMVPKIPSFSMLKAQSMLNQGGRVFILDLNGILMNECKSMGAKCLSLSTNISLSINPYTNIPEYVFENGSQIRNEMLSLLRESIFYMSSPLSDVQRIILDQSLNYAWLKDGSKASIDTIIEFLLNHEKHEAHRIALKLMKYSSNNGFVSFFEGPCQLNLTGNLNAVNLSQVCVFPRLKIIILQFLLLRIFQEVCKSPLEKKTEFRVLLDVERKIANVKVHTPFNRSTFNPVDTNCELDSEAFLVVINDSENRLRDTEITQFLNMYRLLIAKYNGNLLISHEKD